MNIDPNHFKCYFVKSDEELDQEVFIEGDTIWCKAKEQYWMPGLLDKTLMAMEAALKIDPNFDYVLRANSSSFFSFPNLYKYYNEIPREKCYAGQHHGLNDRYFKNGWVCGAGILMSKDVAENLVKDKNELIATKFPQCPPQYQIDDVVIGAYMAAKNIPIINYRCLEVYNYSDWSNWRKQLDKTAFEHFTHFRIKIMDCERIVYEVNLVKELIKDFYGVLVE